MNRRTGSRLVLAATLLYLGLLAAGQAALPPCPFAELLGLACPMCGTGRATELFAQGDVAAALKLSPALFFWWAVLVLCLAELIHNSLVENGPGPAQRLHRRFDRSGLAKGSLALLFLGLATYNNLMQ